MGANIRKVRTARAISQEALAHDAGIAPSFLSQIENGKRSPTVTTLASLAQALDVRITEFFQGA